MPEEKGKEERQQIARGQPVLILLERPSKVVMQSWHACASLALGVFLHICSEAPWRLVTSCLKGLEHTQASVGPSQ